MSTPRCNNYLRKILCSLICTLFLTTIMSSYANTVHIGTESIIIPTPPGYSPVTTSMPTLYDYLEVTNYPRNKILKSFIQEKRTPEALHGEIPELDRYFSAQTSKKLENSQLSLKHFQVIKRELKENTEKLFNKIKAEMPTLTAQINQDVYNQFDIDLAFSVNDLIPLQHHEETNNSLSFSTFRKMQFNDEEGNLTTYVGSVTTTILHIKNKFIYLYTFGGQDDLEWTRIANAAWAKQVLLKNQ